MAGLRERKRQRTHDAISGAAISLFLAEGFDRVSVADIAAAAEVSKPTLFKYFATKEDLVLHRIDDHRAEAARVVAASALPPLAALQGHFRDGLERRDPVTGLNDVPQVLAFHRLVFETPALASRVASYAADDEAALASALSGAGASSTASDARVAASQIVAVQRVLARDNWARLVAGESADARLPGAIADADRAYGLLRGGLGALYG
jgi:AcrR family transcriptional regulator